MKLNKLEVSIVKLEELPNGTVFIDIKVSVSTTEGEKGRVFGTQQIIDSHDFESRWDVIWDSCKHILDEELAK